eukprot:1188370-Prorocentrum_minimum.AAC.3
MTRCEIARVARSGTRGVLVYGWRDCAPVARSGILEFGESAGLGGYRGCGRVRVHVSSKTAIQERAGYREGLLREEEGRVPGWWALSSASGLPRRGSLGGRRRRYRATGGFSGQWCSAAGGISLLPIPLAANEAVVEGSDWQNGSQGV